jgi:hypothetical protein
VEGDQIVCGECGHDRFWGVGVGMGKTNDPAPHPLACPACHDEPVKLASFGGVL